MKHKLYIFFVITGIGLNSGFAQSPVFLGTPAVSENVTLSVIIPKIARVELGETNNVIEISDTDVTRGYATLPKAISLKVWCNSSGGALVETELNGSIYDQDGREFPSEMLMFRLSGNDDFQPFSSQSQTLYQSENPQRGSLSEVDLRLNISKEMAPGKYFFQPSFTISSI
jgi:hypothetical protein